MFGFFKKSKQVDSTMTVYDLKPLYNSLSSSQKSHFEALSDMLHMDIHQMAIVSGFNTLLRCAVGQKKGGGPEFITPTATQMYLADSGFASYQLNSFYPISKFDSIAACKNLVNERLPQNSILSVISGEAAVRLLRGDFFID
jgi:hypothetical protein